MRNRYAWALTIVTCATSLSSPSVALSQENNENVFVFGGAFQNKFVWDTALFWEDHYERNFFAGVGYQNFLYQSDWGLKAGLEVGAGVRSAASPTVELWAGVVARYDGLHIGEIAVSPAITGGISVVTGTVGVETERAENIGRSVPVLFYMGPEIAFSHPSNPQLEYLLRIQHRSGGYGIIAPIDGSNAATFGVRLKF